MPTNDHQDDELPPTTAAAGSDETAIGPAGDVTEIVPPLPPGAPGLAWAHDDDDDDDDTVSWGTAAERASVILIGAVAAALVVGLLMWLGFYLYGKTNPAPAPGAASPAATVPAAALPPISPAAAPVPPPSTVTVTPAPPPTVTVQAAPPPPAPEVKPAPALPPPGGTDIFTICPDGHEGVVGGHTSCAFAENVRRTFYNSGMANTFTAYSPVTGDAYEMTCAGRYPAYFTDGTTKVSTRCYGGDNAEVVIW
ncbi:hypothetical protein KXD96_15500 [Mycobacterium sp. SMC-2]|uniref:hypothetical protein n=1 Tax=Mycobacterium sp. SMC-2 TaxID=2857058 RepID=UPI0021B2CAB7|nr:hypothetical protein [Mycobacterium sp. SMC-2]UXA04433.1 hypothetical protein KXD96_15500 [Mycobacterium sp. SMC-2]